ncbi:MAG: GTPase [Gammaproteobacteria bacterium]
MPANLTPEYKAAEAAFRSAKDPKQRLECLREMLRTIPKHKGTDHLQADIKSRIKELKDELSGAKKSGTRNAPATVIRSEGAAQVALIGSPNVGKSALHSQLTGSNALIAPYPFTTQFPQPGMLPYQDIYFQIVDLPPLSPHHPVPWFANALQPADASLLIVDLSDPECVEQVLTVHALLAGQRVTLTERWDDIWAAHPKPQHESIGDPFALCLPTLMVINKTDLIQDPQGELEVFQELVGVHYPVLSVSASTRQGLEQFGPWLFEHLGITRVYTKAPGRPPDTDRPFTVRRGQTVHDVAMLVHRDIAASLKYARLWRGAHIHGQQVGAGHIVSDQDVLELHT